MAYIEIDEFKRKLIDEKNFFPAIVARALDEMPPADVVPRAEVERLSKELNELAEEYSNLIIEKDKIFDEGEAWYKKAKELETELNAMRGAANSYKMHYENAKTEVAREIFAEIDERIASLEYRANTPRKTVKVEELKAQCDWILHEVIPKTLAELKKKYIGDKR